jgi:hypothetical protein
MQIVFKFRHTDQAAGREQIVRRSLTYVALFRAAKGDFAGGRQAGRGRSPGNSSDRLDV